MSKRIALFSDGTGNSSGKAEKTNVWRLFQSTDQVLGEQLVMYHDGVGTSSNKYLAAFGGAFGWGLKRGVLDLYKFVCRNYMPDDEIFAFGFSRGAFTVRVLTDLILQQGLVDYRTEEELDANAKIAYRRYRDSCFKPTSIFSPVRFFRWVRNSIIALVDRLFQRPMLPKAFEAEQMHIKFLGLWDTVSAYGMPIEEFRPVVNFLFWPMLWDNLHLPRNVVRACHALSLDDERTTFHPIVFDERRESEMISAGEVASDRLTQVWFAGVHSNLGGGYPEDQLSYVSLDWMMSQASAAGLKLIELRVEAITEEKSAYARLYDSRTGFGVFYRYSPRIIDVYQSSGEPIYPVIHYSVMLRMAFGSDDYVPLALPAKFEVLAPDGSLVKIPVDSESGSSRTPPRTSQISSASPTDVQVRMDLLRAALEILKDPDGASLDVIEDTIWWRRVAYFSTLYSAIILAIFPFITGFFPKINEKLNVVLSATGSMMDNGKEVIDIFLPGFMLRWTDSYAARPLEFITMVVWLGISYVIGNLLAKRIKDRGKYAWYKGIEDRYLEWLLVHSRKIRRLSKIYVIAALVSFGLVLCAHIYKEFSIKFLWISLTICLAVAIAAFAANRHASTICKEIDFNRVTGIPVTQMLLFARWVRNNKLLLAAYRWVSKTAIPFCLGGLLIVIIFSFTNRALVSVKGSTGASCPAVEFSPATRTLGFGDFDISNPCQYMNVQLSAGKKYRISLEDSTGIIFDRTVQTDLGGFPNNNLTHWLAFPLKRWWRINWFTPIVRIGNLGDEEYPFHSLTPLSPLRKDYVDYPDHENDCKSASFTQERCNNYSRPDPEKLAAWVAKQGGSQIDRRFIQMDITPKRSGGLYLYLNDASLPLVPLFGNKFYRNNTGIIKVRVYEIKIINNEQYFEELLENPVVEPAG